MEETLSFFDLADEITPFNPTEDFLREFQAYMEKSIMESRLNEAKAWESARDIIIF